MEKFDYRDSELPEVVPHEKHDGLYTVGDWTLDAVEEADEEDARKAALTWIAWYEHLANKPPVTQVGTYDDAWHTIDEAADSVNHPAHYTQFGAEVIEITEHLNFCRGNAVKYLARAGFKNPETEVEDLQKALWYVNRELKRLGVDQR